MREFRRPLLMAAAFTLIVAVRPSAAQTVVVTKAPPGATIELGLNDAAIGSATADAVGNATLPVNLAAHGRRPETDAHIFVDVCERARRVTLVEVGWQPPPPAAGCTRHEIFGVFYLKSITTIVVNASEQAQAVWIKQGPAPETWLKDVPAGKTSDNRPETAVPTGLVLFGGVGLARYANASTVACGTGSSCSSNDTKLSGRFGGDYWIRPFLGVSASYMELGNATAEGAGSSYRFDTSLNPNVVTISGKIGIPVGRARLYGEVGTDYNWATLTTTEIVNDRTLTNVDGTTTVVPGGTQTFTLKTDGWNWTWGGGGEFWLTRTVAAFGEFSWAKLTGNATGGGEGSLDEIVTSFFAGVRVHIGGKRQ
jgi:hypothetical protein